MRKLQHKNLTRCEYVMINSSQSHGKIINMVKFDMKKLFWVNPYQKSLVTRIVAIKNNQILLAETIIFSFSGGQESDTATINGLSVISSIMDGDLIWYNVNEDCNLKIGDEVFVEIDWARRYKLMRLHFAAELILELVTKKLSLEKIGAHISETKARIDFKYEHNISIIFDEITSQYDKIIKQDMVINTGFVDINTQQRFWEIDGFSKINCGGTHVKSTAEVGFIQLKRVNLGSSKERIEITLINS